MNMILEEGKYYHLYNRSNNFERVFLSDENYQYFLKKIITYLKPNVEILAYCLMPTHFHFLIKICKNVDIQVQRNLGLVLSSYTKAINKRYSRHGSLFQAHTKAKEIIDEQYLITLISYIHQNPLRSKLVSQLTEWKYSSYKDICVSNTESMISIGFYRQYFCNNDEFRKYSEEIVHFIRKEYWI
jgi:putative transposase